MSGRRFRYAALDAAGARLVGALEADSVAQAAALLGARGLTPITLRADRRAALGPARRLRGDALIEVLLMLGQLLAAGAGMSAALATIRHHGGSADMQRFCAEVERGLAAGRSTSDAFAVALGESAGYVPAIVAAGEVGGDLPAALQGLGAQLRSEAGLRGAIWGAVSYPLFIAAAAVVAFLVLLLAVVPALAPLIEETGAARSGALGVLLWLSRGLERAWPWLAGLGLAVAALAAAAWRQGALRTTTERLLLDGPFRSVVGGLAFGGLAAVLGRLLAAGVPAPEAFRLAAGGTRLRIARARMLGAMRAIYEGAAVGAALASVRGLPASIVRMATLGEQSGALGVTVERAGALEQARALRAVEAFARVLGPGMIVGVGLMIGVVMGGLLSAVTNLGDAVLG